MKPASTPAQSPAHMHVHEHAHDHEHDHEHGPLHLHASAQASQSVADLKSPVLIGLGQRLLWVSVLLVALWLVVFWALYTNG